MSDTANKNVTGLSPSAEPGLPWHPALAYRCRRKHSGEEPLQLLVLCLRRRKMSLRAAVRGPTSSFASSSAYAPMAYRGLRRSCTRVASDSFGAYSSVSPASVVRGRA